MSEVHVVCYVHVLRVSTTSSCSFRRVVLSTVQKDTCAEARSMNVAGPWCVAKGYILMIITVEIAPDLEQQLRQEASRAGLAPDAYIMQAVQERLTQTSYRHRHAPRLSSEEAQLLAKINLGLSPTEWERYHTLVARRKAETLTPDEQTELIALSDRLEEANAQRIGYLAELARVRHTTLDAVMSELGLTPDSHG